MAIAVSILTLLVAGCSPNGDGAGTGHLDSSTMVSAGVLRLDSADGKGLADLTIRRMTALDVFDYRLPRCAVNVVGRRPRFFDLNWTAVHRSTLVPSLSLTAETKQGTALTVVEPDGTCDTLRDYALGQLPADTQLVLQLLAPGRVSPLHALRIDIAGASRDLPLIRACGHGGQPSDLSCAEDPVTYEDGSPFSVSVRARR